MEIYSFINTITISNYCNNSLFIYTFLNFGRKKNKMKETCTTYTPTTDTSERCLICGELKYDHNERV